VNKLAPAVYRDLQYFDESAWNNINFSFYKDMAKLHCFFKHYQLTIYYR